MIYFKEINQNDELVFLNEVRNECAEEFLHDSTLYSIEDTKKWYKTLNIPYFIVFLDEKKIGYFRVSNYSKINKNIYVGMDLHKNYRGKGLAIRAYRQFLPYLFERYNLNKISLEVLETNRIARALYKKLGFVEEGVKRQEVWKKDTYINSIIMSLLKSDMEIVNERT